MTVETQDPARPPSGRQLPLSPALRTQQARELSRRIGAFISGTLNLTITDNRSVMISVQRDPRRGHYTVRLHHLFIDTPEPMLRCLARYIAHNDRDASLELNEYIERQEDRIRPIPREMKTRTTVRPSAAAAPRPQLSTRGRYYDLAALFDELNRLYFGGRVRAGITWGRQAARGRARRSVRVGSYCVELDLIRIHPGMDQAWIPLHYIQWVIYHEMLHALHPIPVVNGRHRFHTAEFARDERRFVDFEPATSWERANIAALLCI